MTTPFSIDNEGIGAGPFLTMTVAEDNGFTQEDIDGNTCACRISGNNEVGKGDAGDRVFGKVAWVSTNLVKGTSVPDSCAVQGRGVARFRYVGAPPRVNFGVELAGHGKVRAIGSPRNTQETKRGDVSVLSSEPVNFVIAVDEDGGTCDVWLG